jgi:phosphatidylglycerophosphate synthase
MVARARKQLRLHTRAGSDSHRAILFARMSRRALFNLPNTMSLSRVVLALAFVLVSEPWDRIALIAVAAFTDFMDGWLARHEKTESTAGALLDPIADRIFVFVAISTYLVEGQLTTAQYFIFLTRDLATAAGFIVAKIIPTLRPAVFRARMLGKIVTVVQLITLVAIVVMPELTDALILTIGLISAASIVDYTIALWRGRAPSSAA